MPDTAPREFLPVTIPPVTASPPGPPGPSGPFGRLTELAGFLAEREVSRLARPRLIVVAGDHGVAAAGVSAQQPGATASAVQRIGRGEDVAAMADVAGAGVLVANVAVAGPAGDRPAAAPHWVRAGSGRIDQVDALDDAEVDAALRAGRLLADTEIDAGTNLLLVGHIGVGATTSAAVLVAALTGAEPVAVVGRGSAPSGGIEDATWMRKAAAVRDALYRTKAGRSTAGPTTTAGATAASTTAGGTDSAEWDPVALLRIAGGADLAVLAALLAQAAARRVPVLLDGVVTGAAALVADRLAPGARAWWLAADTDPEPASRLVREHLGLSPLLDLRIRVGDGSGTLAALPLVRLAGALRGAVAAP